MAQPANLPEWGTDTNFASGPKTGQPVKVDPSLGARQQGDVPGQPYRSERHNWILYTIYLWCVYLKNLAGEAITWTGVQTFNAAPVLSSAVDMAYSAAKTFVVTRKAVASGRSVFGSSADVSFGGALNTFIVAGSNATGTHTLPIELPLGATLTGWEVMGLHNAFSVALATADVSFYEQSIDFPGTSFNTGTLVTTQSVTGNNAAYKKTWTGTKLFDGTKLYWIEWTLNGVAGGASAVSSSLVAIKITYTDPKAIGSRQ